MRVLTLQAFNNDNKMFRIPFQPGKNILQLANEGIADPRRDGIPFLCSKGVCRSCTVHITDPCGLLAEPTKNEQRALGVGRTTIASGYRLACTSFFKEDSTLTVTDEIE